MNTPLHQPGITLARPDEKLLLLHHLLRPTLLLFLLLLAALAPAMAQPTLSTDLPDYPPGAVVTITGTGFAPGETVTVQVTHANGDPAGTDPQYHLPWTVTADSSGGFLTTWTVPMDGDAEWATLIATANGASSGLHAEVLFTDAPSPCLSTISGGTTTRCQGTGQDTYTATLGTTTGLSWTVTGAGNSISFVGGSATVTWGAAFSGTATISVSVDGSSCTGAASRTLNVTVNPLVAVPVASAGTGATATQITASWGAAANATKYLLDVSTDAAFGSFVTAAAKTYNGFDVGNVTSVAVAGLTANTTYYYRLRASNGCGASAFSNVISYATLPAVPAAPVAAAGTGAGCTQITANWSGTTGATDYLFDLATNSNFNGGSFVGVYKDFSTAGATSLTVTGLTAGTTYFYRVRASNSGGASAYSGTITYATLTAAPGTPGTINGLQAVCANAPGVAYSVTAVANASTYNWSLPAGATIATGSGSNAITVNFGTTSGNVSVTASNGCGTSAPRSLSITLNAAPVINTQPASQSLTYGTAAVFTAGASATPTPTFQWQEFISSWNPLSNGGGYSGVATATLRLALPVVALSGRKYRCVISNSCGSVSTDESAVLTVSPRPITISADAKSKTYGDADPALTAQVTAGSIVGTDAVSGTLQRATGENVGPYAISQSSYTYGTNYLETYIGANLTIGQRSITIKADAKSKTYGDADPSLTAQVIAGTIVGTDAATGSLQRAIGEHVGRYAIGQGSYTYGANYLETYSGDSLSIRQRAITVRADALGKVYGTSDPALTAQVTAGNVIGTDAPSGVLSRAPGENVGSYAISNGSYTYGPDYLETYVGASFTISQRPLSILASAGQHKTYGDADPSSFSYALGAGQSLASGDVFAGGLTRVGGEVAGTYNILQGSLSVQKSGVDVAANYSLSYTGALFAIDKRSIMVTADALGKTYGDDDPALTFAITAGSLAFSDGFSGALARAAGEHVGLYTITLGTLAVNSNYTIAFNGASFTIGQRAITLTAGGKSKVYGDADPALTVTITSGSIAGTDAATGALSRAAGENVGTYAISQGTYTYGSNYIETYVGANLVINARPLTINVTTGQHKTYGDANPASYAFTLGAGQSLASWDAFNGGLTRQSGESAGSYNILQTGLGIIGGAVDHAGNYTITYNGSAFTIDKRLITITAAAKNKTYGDIDPALTYGITSGSLAFSDAFTGALSRQSGENVGVYNILQGTLALNSSYILSYVGASFTIGQRAITLTAAAKSKTYGYNDPALTVSVTFGTIAGTDVPGGSLSRAAGENVGTYAISQGTYTYGSNYLETYVGANLVINARPLTINVTTGQHKTYGDANPASYAFTLGAGQSLASWDAFNGGLTRQSGESAGSYNILQTGLEIIGGGVDHAGNYTITYNGSAFTIDKRLITITAAGKAKTYGDTDPPLTYAITSGTLAFSDAFTGSLLRDAGEDVGSYPIRQGSVALNSNYTITYSGASLTIAAVVTENYVGVQAPGYRQYSDTLTIRAEIEDGAPRISGLPGAASSVTFKMGTQVLGTVALTVDGDDLVATLPATPLVEGTPAGQMAPGAKTITAVFNNPNPNYGLTLANNAVTDLSFRIDKEDARIDYTGDQIMGTASATATTATVKLRANIIDITALSGDAAYDAAGGDIRNAKVKFVNRDNGTDISGWISVSTLVAADPKVGIVSFDYPITLGSTETDREITVGIIVDNGYYYRNNTADNTVVVVYKPTGDFITGGGHVVPDKSTGAYKSDAGTRTNFGFNVKYNKKGANLQGNMNIVFRRTETDGLLHTYQIKANALLSLGVNAANPLRQTAQFSSKANLTDVTNPAAPIAKGGNKTIYVNMIDNGDPGVKDSISIVLVEGTADPAVLSNILYSSEWVSSRNGQMGLRGGNLVVKSGFSIGTTTAVVKTTDEAPARRITISPDASQDAVSHFSLRAYPNATHHLFHIIVESGQSRGPITLRIYDLSGKLLQQFSGLSSGQTLEVGSSYARGVYIAEMVQGGRRVQLKLIKE
jgi:hypothetical protein